VVSLNTFGESSLSPIRTVSPNAMSWKTSVGEGFDNHGNIYDLNVTSGAIWMNVFGKGDQGSFRADVVSLPFSSSLQMLGFEVGGGGHAVVLWNENGNNTRLYVSVYSPAERKWSPKALIAASGTASGVKIAVNVHGDILVGYMQYSQVWGPDGVSRNVYVPLTAFKASTSTSWLIRSIDGGLARAHTPLSNVLSISMTDSGRMLATWQMTKWISGASTTDMPTMLYASFGNKGVWQNTPDEILGAQYYSSTHAYLADDTALITLRQSSLSAEPEVFSVHVNGNWSAPVARQGVRMGDRGDLISAVKDRRYITAGNALAQTNPALWQESRLGGSKSVLLGVLGAGRYAAPRIFWQDDAGLARQSYFDGSGWRDELPAGASPVTAMSKGRMDVTGGMVVNMGDRIAAFLPHQSGSYAPVVSAIVNWPTVPEGGAAYLSAYIAEAEGKQIASYQWSQISGPQATLSAPDSRQTTAVMPQVEQQETAIFMLRVVDAGGVVAESTVQVVVNDLGPQPTVDAGPDQIVNEGDRVTLSATATGQEGNVFTYYWTQISGPAVTLNSRYFQQPAFTAPEVIGTRTLEFEVIGRVQGGNLNRDTVIITVNDLDPIDSTPPTVSHSISSWKVKGKTYYEARITSSEPGQILFRHSAGLIFQGYAPASTEHPGWYVYSDALTFQAGTGSKVIEYFAVDPSGNASAIQSTGEL
jgi:hypothetical protein